MTGALAGYHLAQQLPRLQAVLVVVCVPVAGQVGISKHGDFTAIHVDSRQRVLLASLLLWSQSFAIATVVRPVLFMSGFDMLKAVSAAFCRPSVTYFFGYVGDLIAFLNLKLRLCICLNKVQ